MTGRRLPLLTLLVTGFVAIVALVAHGRPLAGSAGHGGVGASFWSYILTNTIILFTLVALVLLATLFAARMEWTAPQTPLKGHLLRTLIGLLILGLVILYLEHHHHVLHVPPSHHSGASKGKLLTGGKKVPTSSGTHFVWQEALIIVGLIAAAVALVVALTQRNRKRLPEIPEVPDEVAVAPESVAEALDESLDDLRSDPDLRRAIVAAYARMENALRGGGLPRRPAEAPLEYLERALHTLNTSGPSVRRLTDLFEWAKFSHHEPEPSMRDEAVEALEAVRDELRAPIAVLA